MWLVFSYIWLPFMIIPVYTALERIPDSLVEASGDLGAREGRTLRSVVLPLALPGIVAGSIFTFSLTLGDFITPLLIGGTNSSLIGNVIYNNIGTANNLPFAAALAVVPIVIMTVYLLVARCGRRIRGDVDGRAHHEIRTASSGRSGVLLFLFVPIVTIIVYAFDRSTVQSWPIRHFTTHWFSVAWHDEEVRQSLMLSLKAGLAATVVALAARLGRRVRGAPVQILRAGGHLLVAGPAARTARASSPASRCSRSSATTTSGCR